MDGTCAVCAEMLEWVAYGQCGHREVCSTCIARLRFVCNDHRCCICKSESNFIFVTKALGDYTRIINDFSNFPVDPAEGQVGSYWYHEGTQAFFDDFEQYKMIREMCKFTCTVCGKKDEQGNGGLKQKGKFRNVEQLKSHLFHRHRLFMCSLCLEGRKIFICEQKLYTRAQLSQHINTGSAEVDGSRSERGGFMGHPMCEFCRNPFYGDSELYMHMSIEHFTCHICQRRHPGQYNYYRNYDDLEIHYRQEHFLCEDEACLMKKFIVFASESEMKRHNAMEHGGRMSRSKRRTALQTPISFQYQSHRAQDHWRPQYDTCPDYADSELYLAIQSSLETANAEMPRANSSRAQADTDHREIRQIDSVPGSFESLATANSVPSSRNYQAVGLNSQSTPLEESAFPPLPPAVRSSHQKPRNSSDVWGRNKMAARLRHHKNVTVLYAAQARAPDKPDSLIGASSHLRPTSNSGHVLISGSASSGSQSSAVNGLGSSEDDTGNHSQLNYKKSSRKGKEKCEDNEISSSNSALEDSIMNSVRELQINYKPPGKLSSKGKSKVVVDDEQTGLSCNVQTPHDPSSRNHSHAAADGLKENLVVGGGGQKPRKRTSKFHRVRLGESSPAAVLDLANSDPGPVSTEVKPDRHSDASEELPIQGAWQKGGGLRLVANWRCQK